MDQAREKPIHPAPIEDGANRPWVNHFSHHGVASNGKSLNYVFPQLINGTAVVKLDNQELEKEGENG